MKLREVMIHSLRQAILYKIGENAKDNTHVIESSDPGDLWFHVATKSSCHVVAVIPHNVILTKKQLQQIITQGVVICKEKSYPNEKNLEINYTFIKHLQLTPIPGKVITEKEHVKRRIC
jgi:predicted ribosome quality control (RQC) complex YloA/Tae2 family protein